MILLDTNAVIAILNDAPRQIGDTLVERLEAGHAAAVSSVVIFELWYGVARSARRERNTERLQAFLSGSVDVLAFDSDDARVAGHVRATLAAAGQPIAPFDVLIAGQALRHGATLVTANAHEFSRVPGLRWENWAGG